MLACLRFYYRKRGSASYIVRQWLLWEVERERERRLWRHWYHAEIASDHAYDSLDGVRRSPEPSARPSAAADSEERQICTTCLFAESVGLCLCFLPSCAMYKDNAVRNVVAEMGRDLVQFLWSRHDWAIFPCRWKVRFDAHLYSLHGSR